MLHQHYPLSKSAAKLLSEQDEWTQSCIKSKAQLNAEQRHRHEGSGQKIYDSDVRKAISGFNSMAYSAII